MDAKPTWHHYFPKHFFLDKVNQVKGNKKISSFLGVCPTYCIKKVQISDFLQVYIHKIGKINKLLLFFSWKQGNWNENPSQNGTKSEY